MEDYIKYTYYDDIGKLIAIIDIKTPKEVIIELQRKYDEVKYFEESN